MFNAMSMLRDRTTRRTLAAMLTLGASCAGAADGLMAPASDTLWPTVKARITIQTAAVSPLAWQGLAQAERAPQGVSAGAILGDYTFAQPSFGSFRATSGLIVGPASGAMQIASPGDRPAGLSLALARGDGHGLTVDGWAPQPYLGLGFSTRPDGAGLSWSADLGLVGESVAGGLVPRRVALGEQGNGAARREMRLSPVLQFGLRYRF